MSITTLNIFKKIHVSNNVTWIVLLLFTAIITGTAIVYGKWFYLSVLFIIPFFLYFNIHKPFIFPFGLYAFFLPLDSILVLSGAADGAAMTKYLSLLTISVLLLKGVFEKKLKQPDTATALLWTLFAIWGVLSFLWAISPETVLGSIRNPVGLLIFYIIVSSYKIQRKEYETLKWFIIGGGFLASAFSLYNYQVLTSAHDSIERVGVTIGEQSIHVNSLAYSLLLPIATCIGKILEQRKKFIKLTLGIVLGMILFSIVLTSSRGAILGVLAMFIVTILSTKQKVSYVTLLIIIGMVIVPFIPDVFFERWGQAKETGGANRLGIWYIGLKALIDKYLILGAGLGNFPLAHDEYGYGKYASHNTYLGIFIELGIIGISLMLLAMRKSYQKIQSKLKNKNTPDSIMLKAAFWGLVIPAFFADNPWGKSFWLLLMMISMHNNLLIHNKFR